MRTELQEYAESFEAELVAFKSLSTGEFIKKYINSSFHQDEY